MHAQSPRRHRRSRPAVAEAVEAGTGCRAGAEVAHVDTASGMLMAAAARTADGAGAGTRASWHCDGAERVCVVAAAAASVAAWSVSSHVASVPVPCLGDAMCVCVCVVCRHPTREESRGGDIAAQWVT